MKVRGFSVMLLELRKIQEPAFSMALSPLRNMVSTGILEVSCSPSAGVVLSFIMAFRVSSHLAIRG
ncbi:hypothetical protein D3C75_1153530 [compost metagenome]